MINQYFKRSVIINWRSGQFCVLFLKRFNMKTVFLLCVLVVVVCARPGEQYTDKYDHLNIREIFTNRRLLVSHIKCLLGKGKCSAEGMELKSHMKDGLETGCSKCTDKQKEAVHLVTDFMIHNEPEYWKELSAIYDPDGKFALKYEKELKKIA